MGNFLLAIIINPNISLEEFSDSGESQFTLPICLDFFWDRYEKSVLYIHYFRLISNLLEININ